jgi:DNA sulfur modification protein DndD
MIIYELKLTNFGIFGGEYVFDLRPVPDAHFNRPIILVSGQNGVGKTTFVEAVRLCLHGKAALGARVGQREYDTYLLGRIHRSLSEASPSGKAEVELVFDYVNHGSKKTYRVVRKWEQYSESIRKELLLWEDDQQHLGSVEEKETLLLELIPPGVADLFFFDGEKINTLSDDELGNVLLADTVKALLGLNIVDQLGKDLDVFITRRQGENGNSEVLEQIEKLRADEALQEKSLSKNRLEQQSVFQTLSELKQSIEKQEQDIALQGGNFAREQDEYRARWERVEAEIEIHRRQVQELCGGLIPFAVSSKMLSTVNAQLDAEAQYEDWQVADQMLSKQVAHLQTDIIQSGFWEEFPFNVNADDAEKVFSKIEASLQQALPPKTMDDGDVFLHVAGKRREALQQWIEQAEDKIPRQFCRLSKDLASLEDKKKEIRKFLDRVPAEEILAPLVLALQLSIKESSALEKKRENLVEAARSLEYRLGLTVSQLHKLHAHVAEHADSESQIQKAGQIQKVLEIFGERLTEEKILRLEQEIVKLYNRLSRKENLVERVEVDSKHFFISLYRNNKEFSRSELSAGERQLFAVATMWALREVSERPLPVIIDTPLSRLDSEHRLSMVDDYFPHVSHQVIIFATDAEIDSDLQIRLQPATSHIYRLEDDKTGKVKVTLKTLKPERLGV